MEAAASAPSSASQECCSVLVNGFDFDTPEEAVRGGRTAVEQNYILYILHRETNRRAILLAHLVRGCLVKLLCTAICFRLSLARLARDKF